MKRRPFTSRALEARFALLLGRVLGLKEEIDRAHRLAESIGIIDGASSKKPTLLIAAEPERKRSASPDQLYELHLSG